MRCRYVENKNVLVNDELGIAYPVSTLIIARISIPRTLTHKR